jgi:hypothetical protein
VSANQRKLVVTFAIMVFASTCTNVRMPPGGGVTRAVVGTGVDGTPAVSEPSMPPVTLARVVTAPDIRKPPPHDRPPRAVAGATAVVDERGRMPRGGRIVG